MVHWPGDPPVVIDRVQSIEHGDSANVSQVNMGLHTGTHMDPPLHYVREGVSLDEMPLDATIGPCRVIQIDDPISIKAELLESLDFQEGERVLFKTLNSSRCWATDEFLDDFVAI